MDSNPPASGVHEPTRLTSLLESLPVAAALFTDSGSLVAANASARELLVIDAAAPLSSQHRNVVLQPLGPDAQEAFAAAREGRPPSTRTVPYGTSGRLVDVRVSVFDQDLLLVTALDVTAREAQRIAHERTTRELDALFALTPASVRIADLGGRILRANDRALREHAARPPETVRELWALDAPQDLANHRPLAFLDAPAMRAFAGITVEKLRLEVRRHGALRVIEAHAAPMRDESGAVIGVMLLDLDVTERVELEAQDDERVRERRLAAIGQLAAGVMHDLNNALNPIMAAAYLLRHHAESPEAVRDYADRIKTAAEIGAATASRVGRFIRQEPLHAGGDEPFDLSVLAQEVLDLTDPARQQRPAGGGEVRVVRQLAAEVPTRGLPGEIREALLNLVQNAIDAMPSGGTLTVRTAIEGRDACIAIMDTGVGMTADVRERAFEPFFSTKGRKGSGLGLAEVYGIARRHRGTAHISSEPGRGTEVVLRLPVEHAPAPPAAPVGVAIAVPQRILVVEDHEDGRMFLRRILEGDQHQVDAVGSLAEARERLAAASPPPYDILLTDVGLPDGSGWSLVGEAKAMAPHLRIGVITGWEPAAGSEEAGLVEFVLRKPLRATELKAHIAGIHPPESTAE